MTPRQRQALLRAILQEKSGKIRNKKTTPKISGSIGTAQMHDTQNAKTIPDRCYDVRQTPQVGDTILQLCQMQTPILQNPLKIVLDELLPENPCDLPKTSQPLFFAYLSIQSQRAAEFFALFLRENFPNAQMAKNNKDKNEEILKTFIGRTIDDVKKQMNQFVAYLASPQAQTQQIANQTAQKIIQYYQKPFHVRTMQNSTDDDAFMLFDMSSAYGRTALATQREQYSYDVRVLAGKEYNKLSDYLFLELAKDAAPFVLDKKQYLKYATLFNRYSSFTAPQPEKMKYHHRNSYTIQNHNKTWDVELELADNALDYVKNAFFFVYEFVWDYPECEWVNANGNHLAAACPNDSTLDTHEILQSNPKGAQFNDVDGNPVNVQVLADGWKITTQNYVAIVNRDDFKVVSVETVQAA